MTASVFADQAQKSAQQIRACLQAFFASQHELVVADISHFHDSLTNIEQFTLRGGKFLRSLLVEIGFQLAGGQGKAVDQIAAAVELLHKYLLVIDDMVDQDELRYGAPSLWKGYQDHLAARGWPNPAHFGRSLSEIDAALMASLVTELVRTASLPAETRLRVLERIDQTMYRDTMAGWQLHYYQNHQSLADASEAEYMQGLKLVSAQYSCVGPLQIGALAAGVESHDPLLATLANYGTEVGVAFQLQDDILGMFGDPHETGKPVGNDFREGKKTPLVLRAYHSPALTSEEKHFLVERCGTAITAAELRQVQELLTKSGAVTEVQALAEAAVGRAKEVVKRTKAPRDVSLLLTEVAQFVVQRRQ